MTTKAQELDKIINYQESIISLLNNNLEIVKNKPKRIAFLKRIKGKELREIRQALYHSFKELNEKSFRRLF